MDIKQLQQEFYTKFHKRCIPLLTNFEQERKTKFVFCSILVILAVVAGLGIIAVSAKHGGIDENIIALAVGILAVVFTIVFNIGKSFELKIKSVVMPAFCRCLGDFQWNMGGSADFHLFASAGVVPSNYDITESDDIFTGTYKEVPIEINEVCYKEVRYTSSGGRTRKYENTVFDGVVITLGMNKNFKGQTVVAPNSLLHSSPVPNLVHTTLEDTKFEKTFDVYTTDEVEARYLLTPSFMERLVNIKTAFKSDKLSCAFYLDKLFISIDTRRDMFVLGSLLKPTNDKKQFFTMFEEVTSIIELIDQLKLDQKIGL